LGALGGETSRQYFENSQRNGGHMRWVHLRTKGLERRLAAKGMPTPAENGVADARETEYVVTWLWILPGKHLWTCVRGSGRNARVHTGPEHSAKPRCRAEVDQFDAAIPADQDIRWFEVPVEHTKRMRVRERFAAARDDLQTFCITHGPLHPRVQRLAGDQFHAHEPDVVLTIEIEHPGNASVCEGLHLPELALQSGQRVGVRPLPGEQRLYRNGAARPLLGTRPVQILRPKYD
jgi:hypothetical protein